MDLKHAGYTPAAMAGIFGFDIKYSLSPRLHNTMSKIAGAGLCYGIFDVPPEKFSAAFNGFKAMGIKGANITRPYKTEALKYIDSISEEAEIAGAVNTVNLEDGGVYKGYNTDITGFIRAVNYEFNKDLNGGRVLLLGAGGAARAILYALVKKKAADILIVNRGISKAKFLKEESDSWKIALKSDSNVSYSDYNLTGISSDYFFGEWDFILNTATPSDDTRESIKNLVSGLKNLSDKTFLLDISYSEKLQDLLTIFKSKPLKSANGLSMLFFQAIESFYIWTGKRVDFNILKESLKDIF